MKRNSAEVNESSKLVKSARLKFPSYCTTHGQMILGDATKVLLSSSLEEFKGKVQPVITSPPFPLSTKKRYGNLDGSDYVTWLSDFAPLFSEFLTPDGSIVVELGNADTDIWGISRRSLGKTVS